MLRRGEIYLIASVVHRLFMGICATELITNIPTDAQDDVGDEADGSANTPQEPVPRCFEASTSTTAQRPPDRCWPAGRLSTPDFRSQAFVCEWGGAHGSSGVFHETKNGDSKTK